MEEITYYHLKRKLDKKDLEIIFARGKAGEKLNDILEDMELIFYYEEEATGEDRINVSYA